MDEIKVGDKVRITQEAAKRMFSGEAVRVTDLMVEFATQAGPHYTLMLDDLELIPASDGDPSEPGHPDNPRSSYASSRPHTEETNAEQGHTHP